MPNIPFPNVPNVPGVPLLPRSPGELAQNTSRTILSFAQGAIYQALTKGPEWGIFDGATNILTGPVGKQNIVKSLLSQALGRATVTSVRAFSINLQSEVSTHTVERGQFATYNKVNTPYRVQVVATINTPRDADKRAIFERLESYRSGPNQTKLLTVVTSDLRATTCTVEAYSNDRVAQSGINQIDLTITLRKVRETATITDKNANAKSASDKSIQTQGNIQPQPPSGSVISGVTSRVGAVVDQFLLN